MANQYTSSFSSFPSYLRALSDTPKRLSRRAGYVKQNSCRSGQDMKRTLRWYDLIGFGLGGMVGAGIFVTTGRATRLFAGPAIIISYAIAGLSALLSAFCYTEFAVDMPVAGGAFSYIRVTFGEFLAFITGANLIIDYVLSNAAVARSFTSYLTVALGSHQITHHLRFTIKGLPHGYNEIDIVAVLLVLVLTLVICYSTKESSLLNIVLTVLHILFVLFIIIMGFWKGEFKNFSEPGDPAKHAGGFFPYGVRGVFTGAAMVYMSYIGYDAVSTMAEEVKNPVKDIPIGVSGSVILVTILYCLMAASMSMLLPYDMIDTEAPFSGAFNEKWRWVSNVIGIGASFGILTSLLVAMLGQARYMCVIGRSNVVPKWFAKVNPTTSTPVNASAFLGLLTACIALFTDLGILLNLVTIGTLFVFYMVANAVIYRRYVDVETTSVKYKWWTLLFLLCFTLSSIVFTIIWHLVPLGKSMGFMLGACTIIAVGVIYSFSVIVPQARKPEFWGVPMMPWLPSISIFLNIFLLGSLDGPSYVRFGVFTILAVVVYVLYSVHASFDAEQRDAKMIEKEEE